MKKKTVTIFGNVMAVAGAAVSLGAQVFMKDGIDDDENSTGLEDGDEVVVEEVDDKE